MEQRTTRYEPIKPIDIVSIVMLLAIAMLFLGYLYSYFHPEKQNVFDQIYYEVRSEKHGLNTVLTAGTRSAYADYDFGQFENIQIPDLDMCLSIEGDTLYILFFNTGPNGEWNTSYCTHYKYHLEEKRLYGERPIEFLVDHFLSDYFAWRNNAGQSNAYSQDDPGEYAFELQEHVYYD